MSHYNVGELKDPVTPKQIINFYSFTANLFLIKGILHLAQF